MAIEKGRTWGSEGPIPSETPVASTDAQVATLVESGHSLVRVDGGDLARTLGLVGGTSADSHGTLLPVDAIEVDLDGDQAGLAVAHVVIGRGRALAPVVVANAAFIGAANVAPRAHPGDGKFDLVESSLGLVDRVKARRRLTTGSQVPHPGIRISTVASWVRTFEQPVPVWIDGVRRPKAHSVACRVRAEAFRIGV